MAWTRVSVETSAWTPSLPDNGILSALHDDTVMRIIIPAQLQVPLFAIKRPRNESFVVNDHFLSRSVLEASIMAGISARAIYLSYIEARDPEMPVATKDALLDLTQSLHSVAVMVGGATVHEEQFNGKKVVRPDAASWRLATHAEELQGEASLASCIREETLQLPEQYKMSNVRTALGISLGGLLTCYSTGHHLGQISPDGKTRSGFVWSCIQKDKRYAILHQLQPNTVALQCLHAMLHSMSIKVVLENWAIDLRYPTPVLYATVYVLFSVKNEDETSKMVVTALPADSEGRRALGLIPSFNDPRVKLRLGNGPAGTRKVMTAFNIIQGLARHPLITRFERIEEAAAFAREAADVKQNPLRYSSLAPLCYKMNAPAAMPHLSHELWSDLAYCARILWPTSSWAKTPSVKAINQPSSVTWGSAVQRCGSRNMNTDLADLKHVGALMGAPVRQDAIEGLFNTVGQVMTEGLRQHLAIRAMHEEEEAEAIAAVEAAEARDLARESADELMGSMGGLDTSDDDEDDEGGEGEESRPSGSKGPPKKKPKHKDHASTSAHAVLEAAARAASSARNSTATTPDTRTEGGGAVRPVRTTAARHPRGKSSRKGADD